MDVLGAPERVLHEGQKVCLIFGQVEIEVSQDDKRCSQVNDLEQMDGHALLESCRVTSRSFVDGNNLQLFRTDESYQ